VTQGSGNPNLELPYFAYGLFKPGELAHNQIEQYLAHEPREEKVRGTLWERDGLPFIIPDSNSHQIEGFVLQLKPEKRKEAYELITSFEPEKLYTWKTVEVDDANTVANICAGRSPGKGAHALDETSWSFKNDPLFKHVPIVADNFISCYGKKFKSVPAGELDWNRFFQIEAAYLLLWSAIERFTAMKHGPAISPNKRVTKLEQDQVFMEAFYAVGPLSTTRSVSDSRNPGRTIDKVKSPAQFYYQVRSNLCHRGKGAWQEGNLLLDSLRELNAIFKLMLKKHNLLANC